jgi:hypothetical protein
LIGKKPYQVTLQFIIPLIQTKDKKMTTTLTYRGPSVYKSEKGSFLRGFLYGKFGRSKIGRVKPLFGKEIKGEGWFKDCEIVILGGNRCNMGEFEDEWMNQYDEHYFVNGFLFISHSSSDSLYIPVEKIVSGRVIQAALAFPAALKDGDGGGFEDSPQPHIRFWENEGFNVETFRDPKFEKEVLDIKAFGGIKFEETLSGSMRDDW